MVLPFTRMRKWHGGPQWVAAMKVEKATKQAHFMAYKKEKEKGHRESGRAAVPSVNDVVPKMSSRRGPPKHQNAYAWKPNSGHKKNETEVGGKLRPYSEITGVCARCKEQIEWKRRYGKYKPLIEPAKCQRCSKRAVRQAHHKLCSACAKEQNACAKCCSRVDNIIGRDCSEVEAEQKLLEEAIKNARERDRRTLLRAMNKGISRSSAKNPTNKEDKVGEINPAASLGTCNEPSRDDCEDKDEDNDDDDDNEDDEEREGDYYSENDDENEEQGHN